MSNRFNSNYMLIKSPSFPTGQLMKSLRSYNRYQDNHRFQLLLKLLYQRLLQPANNIEIQFLLIIFAYNAAHICCALSVSLLLTHPM